MQDGLIGIGKVERELRKMRAFGLVPANVPLAQQRVFVAGAREIDRVCGTDPTDETLQGGRRRIERTD